MLHFEPFRLDRHNEQLWRGQEPLRLTLKAFAVLRYLIEHAAQLVTKEDVINVVWPETYVSETALAGCIREIRQALGDDARTPRFIETVHRRGYRFIAPVITALPQPAIQPVATPPLSAPAASVRTPPHLVGRDTEMVQLQQGFTTPYRANVRSYLSQASRGLARPP